MRENRRDQAEGSLPKILILGGAVAAVVLISGCGGAGAEVRDAAEPQQTEQKMLAWDGAETEARADTTSERRSQEVGQSAEGSVDSQREKASPTNTRPVDSEASGAALEGDASAGEALYGQFCSSCHGETGAGDGVAARSLTPKPTDFTDERRMAEIDDSELYAAIRDGGSAVGKSPVMPGWKGTLSDDQVRDVIAFVRSLSR